MDNGKGLKYMYQPKFTVEGLRRIQNFGEQHPDFMEARTEAKRIKHRLEYLRGEIQAEKISYGEIAELQSLAKYISPDDFELLLWAGVKEFN